MVTDAPERIWLRVPEAAQLVGLSRSTLFELIASGDLRPVRIGRALRIPVRELREWAERMEGLDVSAR
jgi:excisionase family DNA binding protein